MARKATVQAEVKAPAEEAVDLTAEQESLDEAGFDEGAGVEAETEEKAESSIGDDLEAGEKAEEVSDADKGEDKADKADTADKGKKASEAKAAEPKTALERAEAAGTDEGGDGKAEEDKPADNVLDILPADYAWAKDAVNNGKFTEWLAKQPKRIQDKDTRVLENALDVLDLFKASQSQSAAPAAGEKATATEVKAAKSLLKELGGTKFTAEDGTEKTLASIAEEYDGNFVEAILTAAMAIADRKAAGDKPDKQDKVDALQARLDEMKAYQDAEVNFWEPVLDAHPDAKKIKRSGKLAEWVGTQNDKIKNLMKHSTDPDKAIILLDAYKESMAKGAQDAGSSKKHKDMVGLHSESARSVREAAKSEGGEKSDEEEVEEGFNEGSKKKK